MSSTSGQQSAPSTTQQLVNNTNALNRKINELASLVEGLSISDDVKETIEQHLQGMQVREAKLKLKALEHYDGKTRSLRSWLTEANLHMENANITDESARVRFIGGHLKNEAWDWFEPIARERASKPRVEWSDRTTRILSSYEELSKAMNQVFGDIDERKTAAKKIQQLKQTTSVRSYITEFQTITANLDWDSEALEDKFQEGLKQSIRDALVYFPTDHENLEQLFERAQRIDREQWSRKERYDARGMNYFRKKQTVRQDREGDVIMTGAKVNMEEAKRTGACFNCGMKGHRANRCGKKKTPRNTQEPPRNGNRIRMVRMEELPQHTISQTIRQSGTESDDETEEEGSDVEEIKREPLDVSTLFQGLTPHDLSTEESDSDAGTEAIDWEHVKAQLNAGEYSEETASRVRDWLKIYRIDNEEDNCQHKEDLTKDTGIIQTECAGFRGDSSMRGHSSNRIQESSSLFREKVKADTTFPLLSGVFTEKMKRRLDMVNYSKLTRNTPVWKEYCGKRTTDTVEDYQNWYSQMYARNRSCKCYGWNQKCWANTGYTWLKHISECEECDNWSQQECRIAGHSSASKRTTLTDIGDRRFIPEVINDNRGVSCCRNEVCMHEFTEHGKVDVPWWACFNETCAEHYAMKARNRAEILLPTITIVNNDRCPCLRKGCACGFKKEHQFHRGLITMKQCYEKCENHNEEKTMIADLDQEVAIFREEMRAATKEVQELAANIAKIRGMTKGTQAPQMDITVSVNGKEEKAIIDSGADVNYLNQEWCDKEKIRYEISGYGKIKAYDGSYAQDYVRKATVEFEIQGKRQRQTFYVLTETGDDRIVLGMPWLAEENPSIDWKRREVQIHEKSKEKSSKGSGSQERGLAHRYDTSKTGRQSRKAPSEKGHLRSARQGETATDSRRIGRAILDITQPSPDQRREEYERQKQEVLEKLPKRFWKYLGVFCQEK
jgi:Retrotransposon gag protein